MGGQLKVDTGSLLVLLALCIGQVRGAMARSMDWLFRWL